MNTGPPPVQRKGLDFAPYAANRNRRRIWNKHILRPSLLSTRSRGKKLSSQINFKIWKKKKNNPKEEKAHNQIEKKPTKKQKKQHTNTSHEK